MSSWDNIFTTTDVLQNFRSFYPEGDLFVHLIRRSFFGYFNFVPFRTLAVSTLNAGITLLVSMVSPSRDIDACVLLDSKESIAKMVILFLYFYDTMESSDLIFVP